MRVSWQMTAKLLAVAALLLVAAAHVSALPIVESDDLGTCDPLDPSICGFPFPNDFWLRVPATGGPARLAFTNETFPKTSSGTVFRPNYGGWNKLDGFSPQPSIMTYFANVSIDNCARLWDINASLSLKSPTILLNADTGELVPHWVEIDHYSDRDHTGWWQRSLMIWPAFRLNNATRYIVAMRALVDNTGKPVQSSAAFLSLRDGTPSTDPSVNARRALFKDIFMRLDAAGITVPDLQLAWDFTVGTTESLTSQMVSMRDDALQRVGPNGPSYTLWDVQSNYSSTIYRSIKGTMMVPWYLNSPNPGSSVRLVLDANGLPVYQGLVPVNFTVLIPRNLATGAVAPAGILQYGHGLFGSQDEVYVSYLDTEANAHGWVLAASTWAGMSDEDEIDVAIMLATDVSNFAMIPDRLHQGMLNALVLMRLVSTGLVNDSSVIFSGHSVIDPTHRYYTGNSLGGIMGTVYMGVTTDVERGVIGVGGAPFGLLLPRSKDFTPLGVLLDAEYTNTLSRPLMLAVMQLLWDRLEPSGYLHAISKSPLPNTPKHRVLIQYGLGDCQVSWLGGQQIGRSVGAAMFQSNVATGNITLFGFPFVPDNQVVTEGNMIVGWDFGEPRVPFINEPPPSTQQDTHEFVRRTVDGQAMMHHFFQDGTIINTCGGPCRQAPPVW